MIQYILIGLLFAGALWYLFKMLKKQVKSGNDECGGSCGCSGTDSKQK